MHAEPITCYRPRPEAAAEFASLPYDVFTRAEAAAYVSCHPRSFLAIDRPETAFSPVHDPYADDVYEKAHELLAGRVADGTLLRDGTRCYYLYRLRANGHEQTGIVAACSVDDYTNGIIRRHELTRPEKVDDRARHIEATGCQTGPVFLAYHDSPVLEALVEAAKVAEPLYDFTDAWRVRHTVWRIARPAAVESLRMMLEHVSSAYIADGHHRMAASARICQKMRTERGERHTGNEAYNYVLCALFPTSQLTVLPYHRVVPDTAGLTEDELVGALEASGLAVGPRGDEPVMPAERGHFGMYSFGGWRELVAADVPNDPVAGLDVSVLQDRALGPVLGVEDPRSSERLSFVGGIASPEEVAQRAGEKGVAFTLHATSLGELMSVADQGLIMPPKSTWLDPKLLSGLFIRRINNCESIADRAQERKGEE